MSNLVSVPKNGTIEHERRTMPSVSTWMDEFFNRDVPSLFSTNFNSGISSPKVNIKEMADAFEVELAAPGLSKSDFNIDLDNQLMSISFESKREDEHKEENYTRREFGYTSFKRSFNLPDSVDGEKITAKYRDGILMVNIPKREEAKQKPVRTIKIS